MDLPALLGPWVLQSGAVGLLAWVALLVFTGRLVPRRVLEDAVAVQAQRADDWKASAHAERERADLLAGQLGEILAFVRRPREIS